MHRVRGNDAGARRELFFRGLILALLNAAYAKRWQFLGVRVGWGFFVVVATFLWAHIFYVDASLHPHVDLSPLPVFSLLGFGICCTWIRERSQSVWWAVIAHNTANLALVALAWTR